MLRSALLVAAVMAVALGGVLHPFGEIRNDATTQLLKDAVVTQGNLERLQRSCGNCHSEQVRWPWYGYVAPVSWMLENDISRARAHWNMSRWADYSEQERITLLTAIGAALRTHAMPPQRYLMLHAEAQLSDAERNVLYEWAKDERRRLRSAITGNAGSRSSFSAPSE